VARAEWLEKYAGRREAEVTDPLSLMSQFEQFCATGRKSLAEVLSSLSFATAVAWHNRAHLNPKAGDRRNPLIRWRERVEPLGCAGASAICS